MKFSFKYGSAVAVLPTSVCALAKDATKLQLEILLFAASDTALLSDTDALAKSTGASVDEAREAILYWEKAGVLESVGAETKAEAESETGKEKQIRTEQADKPARVKIPDALPAYTSEELGNILERREEYKQLVDDCQKAFGKIFNPAEVNIVIGLADYLSLPTDYIHLLFAHCGSREHKSVRSAEKLALKLFDEGITDTEVLAEYLKKAEEVRKIESGIRRIFGLGARTLTGKEKTIIAKWVSDYGYGADIIERAYDVTINSTSKPSIPYAGAVIDRWHADGIKTVDDIEKDAEAHKKKKKEENQGSFDTDDFFEAALKRSIEKLGLGGDNGV